MATIDFESLRKFGSRSTLPVGQAGASLERAPSIYGQPITDSVYGINFLQTPLPVPMNKDHYGITFFTRPQLNLQAPNIAKVRRMQNLLTTEELSFNRVVRCYLDPRLQFYSNTVDAAGLPMGVDCALVDPYNPFIPLLSNHLISMSGVVPDKVLPVYRSPEGQYREVHSMADGTSSYFGAHTISATFRNSRGDPITKLFDPWVDYPGFNFEGILTPYLDLMLGGVMDYNTRIYRVTLDPSKRYVTGISAPGAAFPLSTPKSQQYDYNIDKPYNDANNQITIQFEANGAMWDDDILFWSFNEVVGAFNPNMRTPQKRRENMVLVPHEIASFFNCRAYPRLDARTRRMEWWVSKEYYAYIQRQSDELIESLIDKTTGTTRQEMRSEAASQGQIVI